MSEFGAAFDRAQRAHDAQEPPSDWSCEERGHQWKAIRVARINGEDITEYKCRVCGKVDVS